MFPIRTIKSVVLLAATALAALGIAGGARAATVAFSDTVLVHGAESLTVIELPFDAPGAYKISATDLHWLDTPLQALSFGVFSATQPIKTMSGTGTIEFFNAGAGQLFVQVYARTAMPSFAGLVSLHAEASVVPLPPSVLLLGTPLGAFAVWRDRVRRRAALARRSQEPRAESFRWGRSVMFGLWVAFVWITAPRVASAHRAHGRIATARRPSWLHRLDGGIVYEGRVTAGAV